VKGLSDFMKAHGEKIAAHVLETYKPLYNLDPTPKEIAILDAIGRSVNRCRVRNGLDYYPTAPCSSGACALLSAKTV
jgi:hypothetical protein